MEISQISNDARGWIMCVVSGVGKYLSQTLEPLDSDSIQHVLPAQASFAWMSLSVKYQARDTLEYKTAAYSSLAH
jgi:hypothetical protein